MKKNDEDDIPDFQEEVEVIVVERKQGSLHTAVIMYAASSVLKDRWIFDIKDFLNTYNNFYFANDLKIFAKLTQNFFKILVETLICLCYVFRKFYHLKFS